MSDRLLHIGYVMQEGVDIRRPSCGPANHVREVILGLVRRGHNVRVLVRVDGRIWKSDDLADFAPVEVRWLDRGPRRLMERGVRRIQSGLQLPYAAWFESRRFAQACLQELPGCDLLYERLSWVGYGAGMAARRLKVPLVLEDNGDALYDLDAKKIAPKGVQRRLSMSLMRMAVGRAAHIVSSGAGWREQFLRRWNVDADRVTTIENGTAVVRLLARTQLQSFTANGDQNNPVTLVYVGGFYPWHGVTVLLEALARARARGALARLLMIGSGDGLEGAKQSAASLGLNGAVTFTGHLPPDKYAPLLASSDVGVSPYQGWPEFSGLKVLDYKGAGLPTIASGLNGHPPTLKSRKTGLIVPPGDVEALCGAILELCAASAFRRGMGRTARLEAEAGHAWEHTVERLEQVFLGVLSEAQA